MGAVRLHAGKMVASNAKVFGYTACISVSVHVCLYLQWSARGLSRFLSLYLSVRVYDSPSLALCLSGSLSLSLSVSLARSLSLSLSFCVYLSRALSLSL